MCFPAEIDRGANDLVFISLEKLKQTRWCTVCKCHVPNPVMAQEHLNGGKHKNRVFFNEKHRKADKTT